MLGSPSDKDTNLSKPKRLSPSPYVKKMSGRTHRRVELINAHNRISFSYLYLNDKPYGRMAQVYFDDFYETYTISFQNSSGETITFKLNDSNFTNTWNFIYGGGKYELENNKKGSLFY